MSKKMEKGKIGYFAVMCLFVLVLVTGCKDEKPQKEAAPAADISPSPNPESTSSEQAAPELDSTPNADVSGDVELENAKTAALQDAGLTETDVTFTKNQRDYDDGIEVYEIEFMTDQYKYEYEIKADDASILKSSKEEIHDKSSGKTSGQTSGDTKDKEYITEDAAKAAALERAQLTESQVKFGKVELDYDDGQAQYEIEFYADGMEYDCTVNAVSGAVIEMEKERMD